MNRKLIMLFSSILCSSSFACESESVTSTHHNIDADDIEPWMRQGALMCNFAQVEDLGNPMWDSTTKMPNDPSFDYVTVTVFDKADYYAISIEYEKPYPDAPHVLCHLNKNSHTLLYVEYSSESAGKLGRRTKSYAGYSPVNQDQIRQIDSWSFSLSKVSPNSQE